ncbi:g8989 [Coccomyxa viridis]|uniref:DNA topoisomerase 2 n=1 Tax=Coccomyxa viridis TaxID=1274662 RepID=A0ABP1G6K2_9CHLO
MDVDYLGENAAEAAPHQGKGKAPAKSSKVLQPTTSHNQSKKAIEDIYQKKTQLEHILLRPDTYIGSTEKQQQKLWVHDGEQLVLKDIEYVPGLYKIFDEILVNAADNKVRDPKMDKLEVNIDPINNTISIWNNGDGVPVEMHKDENVYVPELIFGHLLTSSNYDDDEKKVTGGRNGYGAKLANIFSTEFTIETCDGKSLYKQTFSSNMSVKGKPVLKPAKKDTFTCVTFKPDLAKFGMIVLEEQTVSLMRKRVFDLAGVLGKTVKVFLNGQRLPIKSFKDYVDLYVKDKDAPRVHERVNDRWEVCICASEGQFQQVSFVNSICTVKGGTHVNHVVDQITKSLAEKMNKGKKTNVKPFMVKNYLSVFINCMIENPAFDSQTKETLTLRIASFGSKCDVGDAKFLKKLEACGITDLVNAFATFKNEKELKKTDGAKRQRITGLTKLDDANNAGGRSSEQCTLILTEGDSAKSLVIAGMSVAGRDNFGVFPLRGKLLNVRDASVTQINGNAEINAIKQILGLQHGKVYDSTKQLRYGHLMIMTDQDHDGSHIKGLIMNFLHHFYPSLLQVNGFLLEFITPIVKATKGKQKLAFFTMPEYEAWKETAAPGWTVKYYKGLGTSDKKEAQEYFADIDLHRKTFVHEGRQDDEAIELAFSKKKIEERKAWLAGFLPGTYLDQSVSEISYSDFVNKELILFSRADLERSIPSMVDGLKPGQRKILFCCFKRNIRKDVKVAQLSGFVSADTAYHHGETSLQSTIIGLAHNFIGSNNVNVLVPAGQFGTRLQGGKDAAGARYIMTRLDKIARVVFHEHDDKLLGYLKEEGQSIEPQWYLPVVPMVLINGAEGIGTGWSTYIPNYNPREVAANLRRLLSGEELEIMQPWYRGFKGTIQEVPSKTAGKSYNVYGTIAQVDDTTLDVTELPVRKWTQDYKEFLEGLIKPEEKAGPAVLADYREHHSDADVHFSLQLLPGQMDPCLAAGLHARFKLQSKISCGNMVLFDSKGVIRRYETAEEILRDFFELRMAYYGKRRLALIQVAEFHMQLLSNERRFILAVVAGELIISNRKKADIEAQLQRDDYDLMPANKKAVVVPSLDETPEQGAEEAIVEHKVNYDYLLSMPISSLTLEKVRAKQEEWDRQAAEVARLHATTPDQLYHADLDAFEAALDERDEEDAKEAELLVSQRGRAGRAGGAKAKKAVKQKKKVVHLDSDADDMSMDDDDEDSDFDGAPKKGRAPAKKPAAKAAPAAKAPPLAGRIIAPPPAPEISVSAASGSAAAAAVPKKRAPKAKAAQASQSSADTEPSASAAPAASAASAPAQELSLMDRLAGRMDHLSVDQAVPAASQVSNTAKAAAAPKPKRTAAKKKPIVLSDSEEEEDESLPSSASEPDEASDSEDDFSPEKKPKAAPAKRVLAAKKPAASKAAATSLSAAVAPAAAKRRPRAKAVEDADDEEVMSPAVVPKGKVRRMRESPFNKASGLAKPQPAKSRMAPAPASPDRNADSEDEVVDISGKAAAVAPAAARPARRAAVAAKVTYKEELSSEEEEAENDDAEGDSDFEASD